MSLYSSAMHRIANWSQRRHGLDAGLVTLTSRRVYILPTRLGLLYAVGIMAMALAGMNYNNNLALLLAMLLGSAGLVAMHHCQRTLVGLSLQTASNTPVFAGELAQLRVQLSSTRRESRLQLQLEATHVMLDKTTLQSSTVSVSAQSPTALLLELPTTQRGWLTLSRWSVSTRYPFGLFRAWSVLHQPLQVLVYPKPSLSAPAASASTHDGKRQTRRIEGDDFIGFRRWQPGDPPQRIAWKQVARGQDLLVSQHAMQVAVTQLFDWHALPAVHVEAKLSLLTRMILDADQQGMAYGLKIPGFSCAPQRGEVHRRACLTALALFNAPAQSPVRDQPA